jgi:hypothetical protein
MNVASPSPRQLLTFFVFGLCLAGSALAQQSSNPPANQDEVNKQLLQRLQELENEVKQLKAQAAAASAPVTAVPLPAPAPSPVPEPEIPTVNEVSPRLKFNVFGDVGAQVFDHIPDTFEFGSLDLFMTARLSDKVSTLGEVLFIAESDNSIGVDVERLLLKYRQSDYLTASFGRYHTWVGFYNTAFNKGEFLETTVDRPFVYDFDDSGGVLPMQDIGANATGKIPSGNLGLNYVLEVGNGRAYGLNVEPAQNDQDANNSKSINGGLFVRPDKISGLQIGFSVRHDNLTVPGPPVAETIATVHGVFINSKYEILNEGILVRHNQSGGLIFNTGAFYTQFSRAFRSFRPYSGTSTSTLRATIRSTSMLVRTRMRLRMSPHLSADSTAPRSECDGTSLSIRRSSSSTTATPSGVWPRKTA